jgi:hypothetical protein
MGYGMDGTGFVSRKGQDVFISPDSSDLLQVPTSLLFNYYWGLCSGGQKRPGHEADDTSISYQCLFSLSVSTAQRGLWPPRLRGFVITHNYATQSVELLWTSDQLVAETST